MSNKNLTTEQHEKILSTLKSRFESGMNRAKAGEWPKIQAKLEANPAKLWSLHQMEITGGEPDVVSYNKQTDEYIFMDCSEQSPVGRRSTCYDREALDNRKANKPKTSALDMAKEIGINILNEEQYRELQKRGKFDTKTSSWIETPSDIRELGGAIFADFRYGNVFVYHNGADSYYGSRGFRGSLTV